MSKPSRPLPAGTRLIPDQNLMTRAGGRLLFGGSPYRVVRLSPTGARLVRAWFAGEAVGNDRSHQILARRLLDRNMAYFLPPLHRSTLDRGCHEPTPHSVPHAHQVTVVIPVKDDPQGLEVTLSALGLGAAAATHGSHAGRGDHRDGRACSGCRPAAVIVVDDGSQPPISVVSEDHPWPLLVIRRHRSGGPGIARTEAMTRLTTPLTLFVDAGVTVTVRQLDRLAACFADSATLAVAPRVRSEHRFGTQRDEADRREGRVERYERRHSPIDLGSAPGPVGPGHPVGYVPTACLAVRTEALRFLKGFDPGLRYGEDVDLVWRLGQRGAVRYVPGIEVGHPPRTTVAGFARQRFNYGSSAGPLSRRHGPALAPARLTASATSVWALAGLGHPLMAGVAAVAGALRLWRLLRHTLPELRDPGSEAVVLAAHSLRHQGRGVLVAACRVWWPVLVATAVRSGRARWLPAALLLGYSRRWRRGDDFDQNLANIGLGVLDDTTYGLGVWWGAIRSGTIRPLLPVMIDTTTERPDTLDGQ